MAAIPAVKLNILLEKLADVSDVWEPIGIALEVENHVIMSTKHDVSLTDITRLSRVLQAWIDNDEDVTWDKMIEVLESPAVNKIAKAKEIRKLIGQDIPDVTTTESTGFDNVKN
jgi:ribosome maturation factor RimP